MIKIKLPRAMDPTRKIRPSKSKSRSRRQSAAAASSLVPVVTKRRSALSSQHRKQRQQVLCTHDKFTTNILLITCHLRDETSTKPESIKKVPSAGKDAPEQNGCEEEEEDDDDGESDFEREDLSVSDEESEAVIRNAKRKLEQLLAETTSLVAELEKMENDFQRLQDEKLALLEQLLACEGLTVNPYPSFQPLTRKIRLLRTRA